MTWSYDASSLGTSTAGERLNMVRFLIGDTDTTDQLLQDEEITVMLDQASDDVYRAGSLCCGTIAAKYSRRVNTSLDGMSMDYSQLVEHYRALAENIAEQGRKYGQSSLGLPRATGISESDMRTARQDTDRPEDAFRVGQFDNPRTGIGHDGQYGVEDVD